MNYYNDYSQFLEGLIWLNKYKNVIEIGVSGGDTTVALCRGTSKVGGKVFGFDIWSSHGLFNQFTQTGGKTIAEKKILENGFNNFELFIKNTYDSDFKSFIKSKIEGRYDFVFIDGCHSYKGILNDFNAVYDNLSDVGTIAFHDTQRIDGCREFIYDLRTKFYDGSYDIIDFYGGYDHHEKGLTILTKKNFPVRKTPIDELCGSISTPDEIELKELKLYQENLEKYKNNIKPSSIDINQIVFKDNIDVSKGADSFRPKRTYGEKNYNN